MSRCKICCKAVKKDHKAMECDYCKTWIHIKCANMSEEEYEHYDKLTSSFWFCEIDKPVVQQFLDEKISLAGLKNDIMSEITAFKAELKNIDQNIQKSQLSFAEVTKMNNPSKNNTKITTMQNVVNKANGVIVRARDDTGAMSSQIITSEIKAKVDLARIGAGVTAVKNINKNGCFLGTISKEDSNKLERELINKLGDQFSVYQPTKRSPQLFITGIEREYEEGQLENEILSTNPGFTEEDEIKVVHKKKVSTNRRREQSQSWMYILQAKDETFGKLCDKHIMVDFGHHRVREHINITRCFNCQNYGHKADKCSSSTICARCAKTHSTKECHEENNLKCINCEEANSKGANYKTNHKCGDYECSQHQIMKENYRSRVSYPSSW